MIPLHEELKEIRRERGLSLEDISQYTKIRVDLLEKIENGDYSFTPMPYIRAFLREYAEVIGVDPERVIAKLEKKAARVLDVQPSPEETPAVSDEDQSAEETTPAPKESHRPEKTGRKKAKTDSLKTVSAVETLSSPTAENPLEEPVSTDDQSEIISDTSPVSPDEETAENIQPDTAPVYPASPETESAMEDVQTTLFGAAQESTAETVEHEKPSHETDTAINDNKRKRIEIEEPGSTGTFFFIIFLTLLIIAAIVIVWMNRSGMF